MVIVLVLVGVLGGLFLHRARRRKVLAGLNSDRPVFSVEPPTRRMNKRKHEAL